MKILFYTYPLAFDCPGGGEIQLLQTKLELELLGHQVELFNMWQPQVRDCDIIHYFTSHSGSHWFMNFVKEIKKPVVISPILYPLEPLSQGLMLDINHLLTMSDLILPNSHEEVRLLSELFSQPKNKFHVVFNGIDDSFLQDPSYKAELFRTHFNVNNPYILCVGNIEPRKNQLLLAHATKNMNMDVILLGNIRDTNYFNEIQKVANPRLRYLGYLPHSSDLLKSAYIGCEIFVLPSTLETPGLAALEACALGAKIVITNRGATKEYFEDKAIYIDPTSQDSLQQGIQKAMGSKIIPAQKEWVRSKYSWKNCALQTVEAYKKVLNLV